MKHLYLLHRLIEKISRSNKKEIMQINSIDKLGFLKRGVLKTKNLKEFGKRSDL